MGKGTIRVPARGRGKRQEMGSRTSEKKLGGAMFHQTRVSWVESLGLVVDKGDHRDSLLLRHRHEYLQVRLNSLQMVVSFGRYGTFYHIVTFL